MAIGNSINDEIKEQHRKVMAEMKPFDRFKYFFTYYKIQVLVVALIAFVITYFIYVNVTKKELVLGVAYVNGFPSESTTDFMDDFSKTISMNPQKEEVSLYDSFYIALDNRSTFDDQNEQKFFLMATAKQIDVCVADEAYFKHIAKQGYLLDLSTVFTEEEMEKYKDRLLYYDASENKTEGEKPIGIEVTASPKLVSSNSFPNSRCYYGIIMNSTHIDNSYAFFNYIEKP